MNYRSGAYAPEIAAASSRLPRASKSYVLLVAALVLLAACFAGYRMMAARAVARSVAIVPAQWLWDEADLDPAGAGVAEAVTSDLANRRHSNVAGWPVVEMQRGGSSTVSALARAVNASKLIVISIRGGEDGRRDIAVYGLDPATGHKRRAQHYLRGDITTFAQQQTLGPEIADSL